MGGLIVGLLLAAVVGPYLIDWNSFRPNFERYAADVLGQPVRIVGNADLTMLPSPTLTLETVEVGDVEGLPMATVDRFTMRVELLPLLSGQIRVTELTLERPQVNVTVDDAGRLDWLMRQDGLGSFDPQRISFDQITINGGTLHFFDARTGGEFTFSEINTDMVEAGSLAGPWRIRGSMICQIETICEGGVPTSFNLSSGRRADDGSLRVTAEVTPLSELFAGTIRTEGAVVQERDLLAYTGTLSVDQQRGTELNAAGGGPVWSMNGGFRLESRLLTLNDFTWQSGDGRFAFTGNGTLGLGDNSSFDVSLTSRQIDLDQSLGNGGPVSATDAWAEIWRRVGQATTPTIPGRIAIAIPTVIVSGSVLQDVSLVAVSDDADWEIESLGLRLPGASDLSLSGRLQLGRTPVFTGDLALTTQQPAALASWWHGQDLSDKVLAGLTLNGAIAIGEGDAALDAARLTLGTAELTGALSWTKAMEEGALDQAEIDIATPRFDVDQLRALADLVLGSGFTTKTGATNFAIRFAADELLAGDVVVADTTVDVAAAPGGLTLNQLVIGDLDGARISVTGTLDQRPDDTPGGALTVTVAAERLGGVLALAERLAPEAELTQWLAARAPDLAPLNLQIAATGPGAADLINTFGITGTAGGTTIRAEITLQRGVADWAVGEAAVVLDVDAPDGVKLARQLGLADPGLAEIGPVTLDVTANGVPAGGLATHVQANLAGVVVAADGTLIADGINPPDFTGLVSVTGDVAPLAQLFGVVLPDAGEPVPVVLDAVVAIADRSVTVNFDPSSIAGRSVEGQLQVQKDSGAWSIGGNLAVDAVNVGWLTAWAFGAPVQPVEGGDPVWSQEPLTGPLLANPTVDLDLTIARLVFNDRVALSNADVGFELAANRARIELRGALSTGYVQSNLAVNYADGQVNLSGQLFLIDVPLENLVWRNGDEPVATGVVTRLNADFSASGRSIAGLVASLSGQGDIELTQGVFHQFAADAFDRVVELADDNQPPTTEELPAVFTAFLDAGDLEFGDRHIQFDIGAGLITPATIVVSGGGMRATGNAAIDLNRLTVTSNWQLMAAGEPDEGPLPQAQLTFAGPLGAPIREVNVGPLATYLSVRQRRENDRLETDLMERERFVRLIARIEADRAAAAAEAAAAAVPAVAPAVVPPEAAGAAPAP